MNESISGRGETSDYSIEAPSPNPLFQLTMDLKAQANVLGGPSYLRENVYDEDTAQWAEDFITEMGKDISPDTGYDAFISLLSSYMNMCRIHDYYYQDPGVFIYPHINTLDRYAKAHDGKGLGTIFRTLIAANLDEANDYIGDNFDLATNDRANHQDLIDVVELFSMDKIVDNYPGIMKGIVNMLRADADEGYVHQQRSFENALSSEEYILFIKRLGGGNTTQEEVEQVRNNRPALSAHPGEIALQKLLEISSSSMMDYFDFSPEELYSRAASIAKSCGASNELITGWRKKIASLTDESKDFILPQYESLRYDVETMMRLEALEPGSVHYLTEELGIYSLGRFTIDMLLEQYRNRDNADIPYGLLVADRYDWTASSYFDQNKSAVADFSREVNATGGMLRIIECESARDALRKIKTLISKYGRPSFGLAGGHGNKNSIVFSTKKSGELSKEMVQRFGSIILDLVEEGTSVAVFGCSTGLEGGFAQELSRHGVTAIGPSDATRVSELHFTPGEPPTINVIYADGDTMIYKNGELALTK